MEPYDFRWSALARYHDAALESVVVLLALARYPIHSHFDRQFRSITNVRSHVRIMSEMHSFCQNSRKAIEIANVIDNKIRQYAYSIKMSRAGASIIIDGIEDTIKITDQNFMWICGCWISSGNAQYFVVVRAIDRFETERALDQSVRIGYQSALCASGEHADASGAPPEAFKMVLTGSPAQLKIPYDLLRFWARVALRVALNAGESRACVLVT